MPKFEIKNIGPIYDVSFSLNKLNVFIGPQSSGKSTIAKIISFCSWLEKDVLIHQGTSHVNDDFIKRELLDFHRMSSYFSESSYIKYEGNSINFEYEDGEISVSKTETFDNAKVSKIAYIPSERNVVSLPRISSFPFSYNNIQSFVFDWLNIHEKFSKENLIPLLDLNVNYYYEDASKTDRITIGGGRDISIEEASSGLQSAIPMYVYLYYLTKILYEVPDDVSSYDKNKKWKDAVKCRFLKSLDGGNNIPDEQLKNFLANDKKFNDTVEANIKALRVLAGKGVKIDSKYYALLDFENNISHPHFNNIIIEEPELNLFPQTQITLVYDMLKLLDWERDNMVITTHSPYILYAINNCILGEIVKNNISEDDEDALRLKDSFINPEYVSVWEIKNGKFLSYTDDKENRIQDGQGLIRNNYFDRIMKNVMSDFNSLINYYDED